VHGKINRMLDRLDLVRAQIANLEKERDAVGARGVRACIFQQQGAQLLCGSHIDAI
jgi:hypothetical protein